MSKPLWWKNSVKLIKKFTSDDSWAEFHINEELKNVVFVYYVNIEGERFECEQRVTFDSLESNLQDQVFDMLHESFRYSIERYIETVHL
ncbi:MAG: hypothetical protein EBU08_19080 [Micrococcales bacterium]|jgi:hypothetical protein|nr:hypothetical protein [Micrococcales bacterium]